LRKTRTQRRQPGRDSSCSIQNYENKENDLQKEFKTSFAGIGFSADRTGTRRSRPATISYFPNDITKSSVHFTAKVASLDTGVKQRDDHLRSADFFEVEKYPDMTFRSTRIERKSDKTFIAYGDLTIKSVTKQIALPVEFYGAIKDSWPVDVSQTRLGGSATLNINRLDYGIRWSQVLDNGSLVVDNNVQIELQFEAIKQDAKK
jgi:polyisoprenoid-binding protein YceI